MNKISTVTNSLARKGQYVLALLTLITGFAIMWGSTVGEGRSDKAVEKFTNATTEIDARVPDASLNGKLVLAAATLESSESLGDDFLKPGPYLALRRRVEMYQWVERKSVTSKGSAEPEYALRWYEGEQDSFSFKVPEGHENPLLKVAPVEQRVSAVRFGGFDGSKIMSKIVQLSPLSVTTEMLNDASLPIEEDRIYVRRTPGTVGPALGDMRVWYEALLSGDYTVLTVQDNDVTLVGNDVKGTLFIRSGRISLSDFSKVAERAREVGATTLILVGAAIVFVGLLSLLLPLSANFDLRPTVELHGKAAAAFISFAISLVLAMLFGAAAYLG